MKPFDYFAPESLPAALDLLSRFNGDARVLAGGSDLFLQMKNGLIAPSNVVDIQRVSELRGLEFTPAEGLRIGALTTLGELNASSAVREYYPCLEQAAAVMGSTQIRNFATVGGNICNASPSADLAPPLIVLGARLQIAGPAREREMLLEDFFLGPGETALTGGELLVAVTVPPPTGQARYLKFAPRAYMDLAVVGAAVWMLADAESCADCHIALGAVAPKPMRARAAEALLRGRPMLPALIDSAAEQAAAECEPIDDVRGSSWYRRRIVRQLVARGLRALAGLEPAAV